MFCRLAISWIWNAKPVSNRNDNSLKINQKLYKGYELVIFLCPKQIWGRQLLKLIRKSYFKYHLIVGFYFFFFCKTRILRESKTSQARVVTHRANVQGRLKARLYNFNITYGESGKREVEKLPTCRRHLCSKHCYGNDHRPVSESSLKKKTTYN